MSVRVSSWVWQHSGAAGNDLLLLLALADVADDGGRCWPSVAHLAEKTKLSRATVQRRIHALTADGRIVTKSRGGTSNVYEFVLDVPQDATPEEPQSVRGLNLTPVAPTATGGASPTATGGASPGEALPVIEPSLTHQEPREKSPKKRLTTLPDDFTITPDLRAWATQTVPNVDIDHQTPIWRDHHLSKGSKFVDWRRAWQKWMRTEAAWSQQRKPQQPVDRYLDQVPEAWR